MARVEAERDRIFAEEEAVAAVQSFLHELMDDKGFSRADLARAMGVSRARVTQLFSDQCSNLTLRLVARAMFALEEELIVSSARKLKSDASRTVDLSMKRCEPQSDWVEVSADDHTGPMFNYGANDNVFGGLEYLRQERANYGMAA